MYTNAPASANMHDKFKVDYRCHFTQPPWCGRTTSTATRLKRTRTHRRRRVHDYMYLVEDALLVEGEQVLLRVVVVLVHVVDLRLDVALAGVYARHRRVIRHIYRDRQTHTTRR